jgi:predicted nuclease with RNAse H fold
VLTAGVDLAAEPKGTALAVIEWKETRATLVELQFGVNDEKIVEAARVVDKLGIDCALGWPIEFVEFLNNHADLTSTSFPDGGMDWRRRASFRESDRHVRAVTGRWPLSVSTDRLGLTAMRCAGMQGRLQQSGIEIDRSGSGKIVEI